MYRSGFANISFTVLGGRYTGILENRLSVHFPLQGQQSNDEQSGEADAAQNTQAQVIARKPGDCARERGPGRAAEIARQRHQRKHGRSAAAQGDGGCAERARPENTHGEAAKPHTNQAG